MTVGLNIDIERQFAEWCARRKAEQQARRTARALTMRGLRVRDPLPMPRVWLHGPKWQRAFNVQHLPIAEVDPVAARRYLPSVKFWWYDFTDDVRERVLEPIRFDVYAEWSDPREQWGRKRA